MAEGCSAAGEAGGGGRNLWAVLSPGGRFARQGVQSVWTAFVPILNVSGPPGSPAVFVESMCCLCCARLGGSWSSQVFMGLVPEKTCRESMGGKDSPSEAHLFVVLFVLFSFELELLGSVGWSGGRLGRDVEHRDLQHASPRVLTGTCNGQGVGCTVTPCKPLWPCPGVPSPTSMITSGNHCFSNMISFACSRIPYNV